MTAAGRRAGILVLTGTTLSLIVSALSFFVHNRLYSNDLHRAEAAESALVQRLRTDGERDGARDSEGSVLSPGATAPDTAIDATEAAFAQHSLGVEPGAATYFDDAELQQFDAAHVRGRFETTSETRKLVPPTDLQASYGLGAVTLNWQAGGVNKVLAASYAADGSDLRLAFRIYRGIDGGELALLQTLPFGTVSWRDEALPIAGCALTYQVWVALLRHGGEGDVLVGAERSEPVTVASPEHFTLSLLRGTTTEAVFLVQVNLPHVVGDTMVTARPGDELKVGVWTTGLTLRMLEASRQAALATQKRLLLTTDGSLVLDPETNEPRTTQTQVLQPVTRLIATLTARDGATRTLQVDLP